jgi:hypothetical protein
LERISWVPRGSLFGIIAEKHVFMVNNEVVVYEKLNE